MAFTDITARLKQLLEARRYDLVTGLDDTDLIIEDQFPVEGFAARHLYVWREATPEISPAVRGEGTAAAGEVDGVSTWKVALYVRVPGAEAVAAEELSRLSWNFIKVVVGYIQQATDSQWLALLPTGSIARMLSGLGNAWYLGEEFDLRVRWHMELP